MGEGTEVKLECCSLRQGFPFGLALLVQGVAGQPSLGVSCLASAVLGFTDTGHQARLQNQTQVFSLSQRARY